MDSRLREAWTKLITPHDYDAHMAAVGQAQANAELTSELFRERPPHEGAQVLFAGAGTGQMFDYVPPLILRPFHITFSDINPEYLRRLVLRLANASGLQFVTVVDDLENSGLPAGFELIVAALVLEHVDWQKAVATMCCLSRGRVFVILQENPAGLETAITPTRPIVGSMRVFLEVDPVRLERRAVEDEFARHGFRLRECSTREVLDAKKMVALEFQRD